MLQLNRGTRIMQKYGICAVIFISFMLLLSSQSAKSQTISGEFFVNKASGLCIDVNGTPGGKGKGLQLWDCEWSGKGPNNTPTDQTWIRSLQVVRRESGSYWTWKYQSPQLPSGKIVKSSMASLFVIPTKGDWDKWIILKDGKPAPTITDFSKYFVVVIRAEFSTGGYSVQPPTFLTNQSRLIANLEVQGPGQGCRVTQSFSYPYWIVEIPRAYFNGGIPTGTDLNVNYHVGPPCSDE